MLLSFRTATRRCLQSMADVVHPPICHVCDQVIARQADQLCGPCWNEISELVSHERCRTCGESRGPHLLIDSQCGACRRKVRGHVRFDGVACVGGYEGPLRKLILRFKQQFVLDDILGGLLAGRIASAPFLRDVDYWIPVPSHWMRRVRRGFQPSLMLAKSALRDQRNVPAPVLRLRRWVPEFHRFHLSKHARSEAIAGAFDVVDRYELNGKCACLIDDVMTTGTTLAEAARVLRRAGIKRVYVAVLAKTDSDSGELRLGDGHRSDHAIH